MFYKNKTTIRNILRLSNSCGKKYKNNIKNPAIGRATCFIEKILLFFILDSPLPIPQL